MYKAGDIVPRVLGQSGLLVPYDFVGQVMTHADAQHLNDLVASATKETLKDRVYKITDKIKQDIYDTHIIANSTGLLLGGVTSYMLPSVPLLGPIVGEVAGKYMRQAGYGDKKRRKRRRRKK